MADPTFYRWLFTFLFAGMWVVWFVLWRVMALRVKAPAQSEGVASHLSHFAPLVVAGCLLAAPPLPIPLLYERFVPLALWPATLGVALTFAGLVVCAWARFVLAGNWSSYVEVKHDHELVVGGPYRWVRHPIYTGLLLMFAGTALAVGEWRGVLAVAIAAAAFWRKLRLEETVMRHEFGGAYVAYAERTRALIPFVL
jgi:protein-S-isoprenylcysteine O-methyltransferase Ste14